MTIGERTPADLVACAVTQAEVCAHRATDLGLRFLRYLAPCRLARLLLRKPGELRAAALLRDDLFPSRTLSLFDRRELPADDRERSAVRGRRPLAASPNERRAVP